MVEKVLEELDEVAKVFGEMSRNENDEKRLFWLGIWTGFHASIGAIRKALSSNLIEG